MKASQAVTDVSAATITEIADAQDPDLVTADVEDLLPETAATDLDPEIVGIDPGTDPDLGMEEDVRRDPGPEIVADPQIASVPNHQDHEAEVKMKRK